MGVRSAGDNVEGFSGMDLTAAGKAWSAWNEMNGTRNASPRLLDDVSNCAPASYYVLKTGIWN